MANQEAWQAYMAARRETPSLAIPGFVLSAIGWLTCGLLCIPGVLFTCLSFFQRGPKGWSIAGLIVGLPGIVLFLVFGLATIATVVGYQIDQEKKAKAAQVEIAK